MNYKFDGKPSVELDHRPFYSITVPCYNSRDKISPLLDSIINQDMKDDIEVILVDDHSTEPYDDVIGAYKDKLCIRRVQTDYNYCPGNTREKGASVATGIWITNCDHDDTLIEGSLSAVKRYIKEYGEKLTVYTNYHEINKDDDNNETLIKDTTTDMLLTHGKFFNMDNLWKGYNIHYCKDLKTHEDIYVSRMVNLILDSINKKPLYLDLFTYNFYHHNHSITTEKYNNTVYNGVPHRFIEVNFKDYCKSGSGVQKDCYDKGIISKKLYMEYTFGSLLIEYYFMMFFMDDRNDYIRDNINVCRKTLIDLKQITKYSNKDILNYINRFGGDIAFKNAYNSVAQTFGKFNTCMNFKDWLDYLDID